jgi:hypothetical protein
VNLETIGCSRTSRKLNRGQSIPWRHGAAKLSRAGWLAPWSLVASASSPGSSAAFYLNKKNPGRVSPSGCCFLYRGADVLFQSSELMKKRVIKNLEIFTHGVRKLQIYNNCINSRELLSCLCMIGSSPKYPCSIYGF